MKYFQLIFLIFGKQVRTHYIYGAQRKLISINTIKTNNYQKFHSNLDKYKINTNYFGIINQIHTK